MGIPTSFRVARIFHVKGRASVTRERKTRGWGQRDQWDRPGSVVEARLAGGGAAGAVYDLADDGGQGVDVAGGGGMAE